MTIPAVNCYHNPKMCSLLSRKQWEPQLWSVGVPRGGGSNDGQTQVKESKRMLGEGGTAMPHECRKTMGQRAQCKLGGLTGAICNLPWQFSIGFACGKLSCNVSNGDHVTAAHCNVVIANIQVPKSWSHYHGGAVMDETLRTGHRSSFSALLYLWKVTERRSISWGLTNMQLMQ